MSSSASPLHGTRHETIVYGAPPPPPGVVFLYDRHGRYYWGRHHRRVYVAVY